LFKNILFFKGIPNLIIKYIKPATYVSITIIKQLGGSMQHKTRHYYLRYTKLNKGDEYVSPNPMFYHEKGALTAIQWDILSF